MGMINCAGMFWSPELVGWGKPGPGATKEIMGYFSGRLDGGRGALSGEQRERQTRNFWTVPGVYALYRGDAVIYVGQADAIGDRLYAHHRQDHLVGRWDAFSWVSPTPIVQGQDANGNPTVSLGAPAASPGSATLASWLTEVEALTILFARPVDNRQIPGFGDHAWFFTQWKSEHAELTIDDMIKALHDKLVP